MPAGRRQRRGRAAAGPEDQDIWRYFASLAFPSEAMVRSVIRALDPDRPQSTPALEPLVDLGRTRLEMVLKVLDVDGAVRRVKGGWVGTGAAVGLRRGALRPARRGPQAEQQAMLDYRAPTSAAWSTCAVSSTIPNSAADDVRAMRQLRGRALRAEVDAGAAADKARLVRPGVEVAPRKQWPSGLAKLGVKLAARSPTVPRPVGGSAG